jgi:hypothetical protein
VRSHAHWRARPVDTVRRFTGDCGVAGGEGEVHGRADRPVDRQPVAFNRVHEGSGDLGREAGLREPRPHEGPSARFGGHLGLGGNVPRGRGPPKQLNTLILIPESS